MIAQLDTIIAEAKAVEKEAKTKLQTIHPKYRKSACNLLHYRVLRSHDLRSLQKKLGYMGLSRLAKSQSNVMASLQTNRAILQSMQNQTPYTPKTTELSFKKGINAVKSNAKKLLGYRTKSRRTRIMVTMPSAAADDYLMVKNMLDAGMNCARINCAHDNPITWKKIIDHIRDASNDLGKKCKIAMDLAGPKIRTGPMVQGPRVLKIRSVKDAYGRVNKPQKVWLGEGIHNALPHVSINHSDMADWKKGMKLFFRDTRGKKRKFTLIEKHEKGFIGRCNQTIFIETGLNLYTDKKHENNPITVGELPPIEVAILLRAGDTLRLDKESLLGEPAAYNELGKLIADAHISCTAPAVFDEVKIGERVLFDDGKIEGTIKKIEPDSLWIEIIHAADGVAKLRSEKGINFPDTKLSISGLTKKDKQDLPFIAEHADVVNFSFVNRPEDVDELVAELTKLDAANQLGIILKIETKSGYDQLFEILLKAMSMYPIGVMIARGDLAIETGWDNIGRVQEEILSLCQAAHVTDIWATQVMEGLAKKGIPSRSEITDAVMAQRADCVMLNKGPYILRAIKLLDTILTDMEPFQDKNAPMSPTLDKANKKATAAN